MVNQSVVRTSRLTFGYRNEAVVNAVDLNIFRGDIYGFIGPNGAGKTTTIKLILGLLTPIAGAIEIFGLSLRRDKCAILRRIGAMVDTPSLYPHLTAEENLDVVRRAYGVPASRIMRVLDTAGLGKEKRKKVREYSLGMRQRLGIAQALLHEPELLILDEPANGLDPQGIQDLRVFLRSMAQEQGVTILISSHILSELEQVVSRVGIIARGTLRHEGSLEELKLQVHGRIRIRVGETQKALGLLTSSGWDAAVTDDGFITMRAEQTVQSAQVNVLLVRAGIEVFSLNYEQASLEEAFFRLIKDESASG